MAIKKYSMGGPITSVKDKDSIEQKEEKEDITDGKLAVCSKCGIQHLLVNEKSKKCACGNLVQFN